jgi:hypothetical protein
MILVIVVELLSEPLEDSLPVVEVSLTRIV